jgi:hypothetical protein
MKKKRMPAKVKRLMNEIADQDLKDIGAASAFIAKVSRTRWGGKAESQRIPMTGCAYQLVQALDKALIDRPDYMGVAWFWHYDYRHLLRDATHGQRRRVHERMRKDSLDVAGSSVEHLRIIRLVLGVRL